MDKAKLIKFGSIAASAFITANLIFAPAPIFYLALPSGILTAILAYNLVVKDVWRPTTRIELYNQIHIVDGGKDAKAFGIPREDEIEGENFDSETYWNNRTGKEWWLYYLWQPRIFKFMLVMCDPDIGSKEISPLKDKLGMEIRGIPQYRTHETRKVVGSEFTYQEAMARATTDPKYKQFMKKYNLSQAPQMPQENPTMAIKTR
jgi:hypothetical protein